MKSLKILKYVFVSVCVTVLISCLNISDVQAAKENYIVKKSTEKIMMIPGEQRMVSTVIPDDSTFKTSNQKVVLVSNSGQLIAKKAGTAKVTHITGNVKTIYTVKVNAEVDLIVFAGQSNMVGAGGSASLAPKPAYGTAYEFDTETGSNKTILLREPFGTGTNRSNGLDTTGNYSTRGTIVSAFCINYYKQTKTPVVGINCAWGGSSTNTWLSGGLANKTYKTIAKAKKQLKKNKVKVRHIYMVWYQGESDAAQYVSASTYISRMKKIYKKMKKAGVEKVFVVKIGHDKGNIGLNGTIMDAQSKLCSSNKNFIMVSKKAPQFASMSYAYYTDSIHINQKGLNEIGYEAGKAAGKYVKKISKKK